MGVSAPYRPILLSIDDRPLSFDGAAPPPLAPPRKGEGKRETGHREGL
jgi:hypothetical protein